MVPSASPRPQWHMLLRPKWLCWHAFAIVAFAGMLWLGDWQLRRAEAGNELSWAYTFEWPIFAVLGLLFWAKSLRDEMRPANDPQPTDSKEEPQPNPEVYAARLKAEVRGHGRWHGFR